MSVMLATDNPKKNQATNEAHKNVAAYALPVLYGQSSRLSIKSLSNTPRNQGTGGFLAYLPNTEKAAPAKSQHRLR